jgi:hypothetical protein
VSSFCAFARFATASDGFSRHFLPFGISHSSEAIALKGKQVTVRHPVKGLPAITGTLSLEQHTSRVLLTSSSG